MCSRCKLKSLSRMASPKIAASTQCEKMKFFCHNTHTQKLCENSFFILSLIDFTKYFLFECKILFFPHCVLYYRCRGFVYRTHMAIDLEKKGLGGGLGIKNEAQKFPQTMFLKQIANFHRHFRTFEFATQHCYLISTFLIVQKLKPIFRCKGSLNFSCCFWKKKKLELFFHFNSLYFLLFVVLY